MNEFGSKDMQHKMPMNGCAHGAHGVQSGFTLLEILITTAILTIGACGLSSVLINSMALASVNEETSRARIQAHQVMEQMRSIPVSEVFALFNQTQDDDPDGEGTAPGPVLEAVDGFGDDGCSGFLVEIEFPSDKAGFELREDLEDDFLGTPRDLNGDGVIDSENHSKDYVILPVRVSVRWEGVKGNQSFEIGALLRNDEVLEEVYRRTPKPSPIGGDEVTQPESED